jgi:hypothetical protein
LVGKPQGKRPFGKSMHRQENNIKLELTDMEINGEEAVMSYYTVI